MNVSFTLIVDVVSRATLAFLEMLSLLVVATIYRVVGVEVLALRRARVLQVSEGFFSAPTAP